MTELLAYLYAETPVHAGGLGGDGQTDFPIQREATTGYPVIWAASLKGALRRAARDDGWDTSAVVRVFGADVTSPASGDADRGLPGVLSVTDAQLVALPVPTLRRTFTWATSQIALARLARKYSAIGRPVPPVPAPDPGTAIAASADWAAPQKLALGPLVVPADHEPDSALAKWADLIARHAIGDAPGSTAFAGKLRTDLLAAGSDVMPILTAECIEITARIHLDDDKTVRNGPFYREYLPAETIMAASLNLRPRPGHQETTALKHLLHNRLLQVGGEETLGKGLMWIRLVTEAE